MRVLASAVLVAEAFVVFFATLVAQALSHLGAGTVWAIGGTLSLLCLLVCGLLRHRWGYVLGSALQVVLLLSGLVVTTMFFLGAVFAVLWGLAIVLGRRGERARAAMQAPR
jgi:hypothetical protein